MMIDIALVYGVEALVAFASQALEAVGLSGPMSKTVASVLVEGDLLGHDTHGLALLPGYLTSAREGEMALDGTPGVLNERPAAALWDGRKLPGPWLITEGLQTAMEKAEYYGTFTLSIRNSHHTAGLVSYLKPVTDRGLVGLVMVSDPTEQCVAPFGGCQPVLSTNPFAIGYPSREGAVMLDMSTAMTTNGMVKRLYNEKGQFAHEWLIDAEGRPSRDPAIRFAKIPGAIMPLGGFSAGYKGTGLGMTVEALTHGLSGNGRHRNPQGWQNNVFIQVLDPAAFGGGESFAMEAGFLADAIRHSKAAKADDPSPRVAGDRAQALRVDRLVEGVPLSEGILAGLAKWAEELGLPMPQNS
nr:Ldh family oxidoreductase [uncultured Cohaesibacter sp.]